MENRAGGQRCGCSNWFGSLTNLWTTVLYLVWGLTKSEDRRFRAGSIGRAASSVAGCDPTISSEDRIGDVKRKLACFADENAKLKQELANLQSQPTQLLIHWDGPHYFSFSADACKTKAIDSVVKRGGSVLEQGSGWVDMQLGDKAVSALCDVFPASYFITDISATVTQLDNVSLGYVIVSGPRRKSGEIHDLTALLSLEIFPSPQH